MEEGDSIYIDAGSTNFEMIAYLPKNIVVVTNGLMHIEKLLAKGIKTFLLGGYIKPTTKAMVGIGAIESLKNYRFDKCFMGVNGIHPEFGYTTPDQEEAAVKQLALSLSRDAYVVADESKFSEVAFAKIAHLKDANIITNADRRPFTRTISKSDKHKGGDSMIYTVTLNPSVDYMVELDQVIIGELNRTNRESKFPGGKGINVSQVLKRFDIDNTALGF